MAKSRKDPRGRMLRKGESWREQDHRYTYPKMNSVIKPDAKAPSVPKTGKVR